MFKMIPAILTALKLGNEIKDPTTWKKGQNLTNACAGIITAIVLVLRWQFPELMVSDEMIVELAGIAALILAFVNRVMTTASSKKVGYKSEEKENG
jgi:hypothetical protein